MSNLFLLLIGSDERYFKRSTERWNAELNTDYSEEDWRLINELVKFVSINFKPRMTLFNFQHRLYIISKTNEDDR